MDQGTQTNRGFVADMIVVTPQLDDWGETGQRYGQHGGGGALFPHDEQIMGWLFGHAQKEES